MSVFTQSRVDPESHYLSDLDLCQECLAGDTTALGLLRGKLRTATIAFLLAKGAKQDEASEIVDSLWADLLAPRKDHPPRLSRYRGAAALQSWLNTVALNNLIAAKRAEKHWQNLAPARVGTSVGDGDEEASPAWLADPDAPAPEDVLLIKLMREAIETAFRACAPEDFVLLQLKHRGGLRGAELGVMFDCDDSGITRRLDKAERHIQKATLEHIRKTDPWLELKWQDFIELCRSATPACFGLD
jgi:DNA-directed RNA polymerase specialized sigma24 family protein